MAEQTYMKIAGIDGIPTINGYSINAWPLTGYHEELLWSGYLHKNAVATLSASPLDYDAIRINARAGNITAVNNNQTPYTQIIPKYYFENNNKIDVRYPMWSTISTTTAQGMYYMNQLLTGVSSINWTANNNFGFLKTTTGGASNTAEWVCLREVWGIKYE